MPRYPGEAQDEEIDEPLKLKEQSPEEIEASRRLIEAVWSEQSAERSSPAKSSFRTDLIGRVMQRHGVSAERAAEMISDFGG